MNLERRLLRRMSEANRAHDLLASGDRVMVCLSGGKDSWAMLTLLVAYRRMLPFDFELVAVNLDQGHPGFEQRVIADHCTSLGIEHHMVAVDTYSVVLSNTPEGKNYCSLCSRLRRGILYDVAESLGASKIALGHHREDAIETLLLNLFFSGQLKSMPPRLQSDDGRNTIIRPLAFCGEAEIAEYAREQGFPILPCDLCGSQPDSERRKVKQLLAELEGGNPGLRKSIAAALRNVKPSHLHDRSLWPGAPTEDDTIPAELLVRRIRA